MNRGEHFTEGKILGPLLRFTLPVLLAVCLQAMYGAVDLVIVGHFGTAADVAAVATGTQIMETITFLIVSLSTGTTVVLGRLLGQGREEELGDAVGGSICLFAVAALVITVGMTAAAGPLVRLMRVPTESFSQAVAYVRICSAGSVCIVAYNVLGSVFRGLGDSRTPLIAAAIACVCNIGVDLTLEAVLGRPVIGAAIATVISQLISVGICLALIRRRGLAFPFSKRNLRLHNPVIRTVLSLGLPVALEDFLRDGALLVVLAIANGMGVLAGAAVGVAEKLLLFLLLVPSAFMETLSAFTAQNFGAGRDDRARRAMWYGMAVFTLVGAVLASALFFHGGTLAGLFGRNNAAVTAAAWEYLQACAPDVVLMSTLFCFLGFFDGCERTKFVLLEGTVGAVAVRIPLAFFMSRRMPGSLYGIGLAAPCASAVRIALCLAYFLYLRRKAKSRRSGALKT